MVKPFKKSDKKNKITKNQGQNAACEQTLARKTIWFKN